MRRTVVIYLAIFSFVSLAVFLAGAGLQQPAGETRYVFPTTNLKRYSFPTHTNDLVLDRADAETAEVIIVVLKPGESPPLHKHDDTEQIFYVMEGRGTLTIGKEGNTFPVRTGDVVRIPPSTWHRIRAEGPQTMRYLGVDSFVGGRPKAEPTWDSHVRVMCKENGWDFDEVTGRKPRSPKKR